MSDEPVSAESGRGALAEFKAAVTGLFDQVIGLAPDLGFGRAFPRHELRVEDDGYRARIELPGFTREQLEVSVAGRTLTVSGQRERFDPPAGARMLRSERPSGKFDLSIRLPAEVDALAVIAQMHDGVLEIRLPRPTTRGRSIRVEEVAEGGRPASGDAMPWEPHSDAGDPDRGETDDD